MTLKCRTGKATVKDALSVSFRNKIEQNKPDPWQFLLSWY